MNRLIIATTLSLALTGTSLLWAASGQATSGPDPKIGTRITITGCLHKGTSGNSFVLLGVTERPADSPGPIQPVPYAIYWLDSTAGLKALVGEMVDVTGKVTERRPKPGTIMVSIDVSETLSTDVNVATGNKTLDVTTKKFDDRPRPTGTARSDSSLEVTRPVYKLAVENVRAVNLPAAGPACR
jgi:hypothetical protein